MTLLTKAIAWSQIMEAQQSFKEEWNQVRTILLREVELKGMDHLIKFH